MTLPPRVVKPETVGNLSATPTSPPMVKTLQRDRTNPLDAIWLAYLRATSSYGYTSIGNIASTTLNNPYTYAGTGYANPHAPTTINGVTLSYDNNGNLTSYGTSTFTWDYRNQITQAGTGTATSSYGYDYQGNRVSQAVQGGLTTLYANKLYSTNGASTTKHIYAGDTLIATVEKTNVATTTHIIHTDHLGGAHVITDANGDVVQTVEYYPFGGIYGNTKTTSLDEVRKFTGHEYDSGVGLNYMRARYQDPGRGQFLSQDPAHLFIGDSGFKDKFGRDLEMHLSNPQALNSYSYAVNNPVRFVDPKGEVFDPITWSIIYGATVVAGFLNFGIDAWYLSTTFNHPIEHDYLIQERSRAWGEVTLDALTLTAGSALERTQSMILTGLGSVIDIEGLVGGDRPEKLGASQQTELGKKFKWDDYRVSPNFSNTNLQPFYNSVRNSYSTPQLWWQRSENLPPKYQIQTDLGTEECYAYVCTVVDQKSAE